MVTDDGFNAPDRTRPSFVQVSPLGLGTLVRPLQRPRPPFPCWPASALQNKRRCPKTTEGGALAPAFLTASTLLPL